MHKLVAGSDAAQQRCETRAAVASSLLPVGAFSTLVRKCVRRPFPRLLSVAPELPDDVLFATRPSPGLVSGVPLQRVRR